MNNKLSRRDFVKSAAILGTAAAMMPSAIVNAESDSTIQTTIAFVGCAHIHTPDFMNKMKERKDVRVKYCYDYNPKRAENWAKFHSCEAISDSPDKIWNDPEVQAVVICSETNRHQPLVEGAAKAKKHAFIEKPLGISAKDSYAMAEDIEKAGILFTTGYFMRTDPKHIFLKQMVAEGAFGKITRASAWNCHNGSLGHWFDTDWRWMADVKQSGCGGFGDLGTHMLDILMWIFGDVEKATADIQVAVGNYGETDEMGQGLIHFTNNVSATLTAGWVDIECPVTLIISGTEGHAIIDHGDLYFRSNKVEGADGREPWTKLPQAPQLPIHQFIDAVRGKEQPLVKPMEAAARVAVMEAMYKGSQKGSWVKI